MELLSQAFEEWKRGPGNELLSKDELAAQAWDAALATANERIRELEAKADNYYIGWKRECAVLAAKRAVSDKLEKALRELSLYVAYNGDDWVKRQATAALAEVDAIRAKQGEQNENSRCYH